MSGSTILPATARQMLSEPVIATLCTVGVDGFPHATPVWVDVEGDLNVDGVTNLASLTYNLGAALPVFTNAGVPVDGTTLDNIAPAGALLIDTTNKTLYQNTGTISASTWTVFSLTSGSGAFTGTFQGIIGGVTPAALTATTVHATGAATLDSTLIVTGAITASGGVNGAIGGGTPAAGAFTTASVSGLFKNSVQTTISASATQTRAGGTALTKGVNNITTCAVSGDAVTMPALAAGNSVVIFNNGAQPASVFPDGASDTIDGGSGGAAVTLTNGKRCIYFCLATNTIISAQLGVVSA